MAATKCPSGVRNMTDLTVAGQEQCQAPAWLEGSSSREGTGAMWKLKVTLSFSVL